MQEQMPDDEQSTGWGLIFYACLLMLGILMQSKNRL